jgi:hypothetical protein
VREELKIAARITTQKSATASLPVRQTNAAVRENDTDVLRFSPNRIEDLHKILLGYRDNMKVEIENGVAVTAKTVADLRALPTWPDGLVLVH